MFNDILFFWEICQRFSAHFNKFLTMIINLPTDIEKKVDHVYISLPFSKLNAQNLLKGIQPTDYELELYGNAEKIRIQPEDSGINFRLLENKSGGLWNFNFNCDVIENNNPNFKALNRFANKKVVLFIGTSTYRYQIGWAEQLLQFTFREITQGFNVTVAGQCYFPASRKQITSFRSTF